MDNVVENNQSSRISYKNYKNRLLTVLLYFIAVLCVITAVAFPFVFFVVVFSNISFSIGVFLILFCLFLLYFIYYTSKRINHAVINKLIILPFIFLLSYYVLNISNARIFYAVLYILFYTMLIVIYAKYWAERLQERKYIFNNAKYIFIPVTKENSNGIIIKYNPLFKSNKICYEQKMKKWQFKNIINKVKAKYTKFLYLKYIIR